MENQLEPTIPQEYLVFVRSGGYLIKYGIFFLAAVAAGQREPGVHARMAQECLVIVCLRGEIPLELRISQDSLVIVRPRGVIWALGLRIPQGCLVIVMGI